MPSLISGERFGNDYGYPILGCGDFRKIDGEIFVRQFGLREWVLPNDIVQPR
jgi:hypothetical protein